MHGSGDYVQTQSGVESANAFFQVELRERDGLPTAQLLPVSKQDRPAAFPDFEVNNQAYRIRRLRSRSSVPCVLEEIWLDASYAPELSAEDLPAPLYLFYREALGLWITRAEDALSIAPCPNWAPEAFAPKAGQALACAERIS